MNWTKKLVSTLLIGSAFLGTQLVSADEPQGVAWSVLEAPSKGVAQAGETPGGDSSALVRLSPWSKEETAPLLVVFQGCDEDPKADGKPVANSEELISGRAQTPKFFSASPFDPLPRWRVCAKQQGVIIFPGHSADINLFVDFLRLAPPSGIVLRLPDGVSPRLKGSVYRLDSKIEPATDPNEIIPRFRGKPSDAEFVIDLYYKFSPDANGYNWERSDYAGVFGLPSTKKYGGTLDYQANAKGIPFQLEAYNRKFAIPGAVRDDGGAMLKATLEKVKLQGSSNNANFCDGSVMPTVAAASSSLASVPLSHTISGRFSTIWTTDHAAHPGWGFKVEIYGTSLLPTLGFKQLGWAWVGSDGSWSIGVPAALGYFGGASNLRVYYRSYNEYFAPMDQSQSKYSWVDPAWSPPASGSFNVGHRYANTDGGTYNGVGELVDAAMTMWSRLYWDGGINPVAASPIKFFYPNTWENCGGSSPWSCATFNGDQIWLIASHGTQGDVVNHEMGHALNAKFWDKKWPANSGGSHSLSGCYPARLGMALSEGFANFVAAWVGYPDRNGGDGSYNGGRWALGWDAEQRTSPPSCANGWENEVWVARTFWDLHDTHADGSDNLWFVNKGGVLSIYLGNGIATNGQARDMRFYENVYRSYASSPAHQAIISNIFDQNHM